MNSCDVGYSGMIILVKFLVDKLIQVCFHFSLRNQDEASGKITKDDYLISLIN